MSEEAKLVLLEGIAAALERLAPQSPRAFRANLSRHSHVSHKFSSFVQV
ncbi:hypothetical protein [Methylosinus sp. PW1]|nr:hypothetical protein [Methylosinus sp. PW1]